MNVVDGNLLILASAGSGKTYQLGNRVIGRVAAGVAPEKIVALTFTRKAAGEFADSVLGKLADATLDPRKARGLADDLGREDADFDPVLQTIVRALPKFTLTTIDSFFTRVVRGFQYELGVTGGRFDLLEGPRAAAERDVLLGDLLGRALDDGSAGDFARAFRRATAGGEGVSVRASLAGFLDDWHRRFCHGGNGVWGPDFLVSAKPGDWEKHKHSMAHDAREACVGILETRKGQIVQLENFIDAVETYELSGGGFPGKNQIATGILDALEEGHQGDLELRYHKPFTLPARALQAIGELVRLAAAAEMSAAVERTRAIAGVVAGYDELAEKRLRRRGLLGFDEVKRLMGEWRRSEAGRLRREMVDFRLDARYEHWLLDEFQDTSREEWNGLLPLLTEAVQDGGVGSVFIVGDRKQAIYGWRGGDVSLFDEVEATFRGGIRSVPMAESWRSCPQVLNLVNRVCGNADLIDGMFGIGPQRWVWDAHESAPPLRKPDDAGEACVEVVDLSSEDGEKTETDGVEESSDDPRVLKMIERMRDLGIGEKDLTCGVLVRRNEDGRVIADALRAAGFDVVQDGVRAPARDHPAGVAVWQLLRWMANPEDGYARRVVEMSPLGKVVRPDDSMAWYQAWENLHGMALEQGYARMIEVLLQPLNGVTSDYGKRRLAEVIQALAAFDAGPEDGACAAAQWLERHEVAQSPGAAAVQVMTIHKSKGLGFDVVFLPMLPDRAIPETQRFKVAEGVDWLSEVPPAWARRFFPEIRKAEEIWGRDQGYEALCQLYVALTRAKRGLYVYLGKKRGGASTDSPTLTNWMIQALGADATPGVIFQCGDFEWAAGVRPRDAAGSLDALPGLASALPRRRRSRPSAHHADEQPTSNAPALNPSGMAFGTEVHECFERIGWLADFDAAVLPKSDAGRLVASMMKIDKIVAVFEKPTGHVALHREQMVDAILDGQWLSGVIDRMHVHREGEGMPVTRIEIIDFKSDAVTDPDALVTRHAQQLRAYARAMAMIHSGAEIELILISTALKEVIRLD
jgi:ATP-dependent helicase/nuclease subunit A